MKIFLVLAFTCLTNILFAQKNTKQQDIQKLLTVMQVKANMQKLVDGAIELYKKQKPAVPQQVWNEIKSKLDYNSYLNDIAAVYDNNYSQQEIKQLIKIIPTLRPNQQPPLKPTVQDQSYKLGNEFGKKFAALIKEQLQIKGY